MYGAVAKSGRNARDSKSRYPQGYVGSNPTRSAKIPHKQKVCAGLLFFALLQELGFLTHIRPPISSFSTNTIYILYKAIAFLLPNCCPNLTVTYKKLYHDM